MFARSHDSIREAERLVAIEVVVAEVLVRRSRRQTQGTMSSDEALLSKGFWGGNQCHHSAV